MKKLIFILAFSILISNSTRSSRIITSFDIARWYLDSDLVLICTVNRIDTIHIDHYDSLSADKIRVRYDEVIERYTISSDSLIKGDLVKIKAIDTIMSQNFLINYSKTQELRKEFFGFDSKGDSIFQMEAKVFDDNAFFDFSYFRLNIQKKHLVILTKKKSGYVIDYQSECNDGILKLIAEIKTKGESYFPVLPK